MNEAAVAKWLKYAEEHRLPENKYVPPPIVGFIEKGKIYPAINHQQALHFTECPQFEKSDGTIASVIKTGQGDRPTARD